ncbi:MAG TPA: helix-turn-helix domain-containing protein [Tepidisphaeraceae bacterium]|nr:helix-turn-helix domain-containing protein [Tepidisphaeraceae bacterium]
MDEETNKEVLNEAEAARFLQVSVRKLFDLRKAGLIRYAKVGKQIRYLREHLMAFLRNGGCQVQGQ